MALRFAGSRSGGMLSELGQKLARTRRRRSKAPAFELQSLEGRVLLSFSPVVAAAGTANEGFTYTVLLDSTGTENATSWTVLPSI